MPAQEISYSNDWEATELFLAMVAMCKECSWREISHCMQRKQDILYEHETVSSKSHAQVVKEIRLFSCTELLHRIERHC